MPLIRKEYLDEPGRQLFGTQTTQSLTVPVDIILKGFRLLPNAKCSSSKILNFIVIDLKKRFTYKSFHQDSISVYYAFMRLVSILTDGIECDL